MPDPLRVVLDTNILLSGIINIHSAAGRIFDACDRRVIILLLSKSVISEYRFVLTSEEIAERYPKITKAKVEIALERLRYVAEVVHPVGVNFEYLRDPRDAKFIELAIAQRASHIVTADKDLLSLPSDHGDSGRRFRQRAPSVRILDAAAFVNVAGL